MQVKNDMEDAILYENWSCVVANEDQGKYTSLKVTITQFFLKTAERSVAKSAKREAKLLVKYIISSHFDAKLRFALLALLRSAIFSEK